MENMKTDFRNGIKGSVVIFIQGYLFIFFFLLSSLFSSRLQHFYET